MGQPRAQQMEGYAKLCTVTDAWLAEIRFKGVDVNQAWHAQERTKGRWMHCHRLPKFSSKKLVEAKPKSWRQIDQGNNVGQVVAHKMAQSWAEFDPQLVIMA